MKYEKIEQFIKSAGISPAKLYRFYRNNPALKKERKKKGAAYVYPEEHLKYFNSKMMFDENRRLMSEAYSMKKLLKCVHENNSLESTLWHLDWSFFATIAYKNERNQMSCFKQMTDLYYTLLDKYGDKTGLNMFFTTEPFTNRKGYHNHFIMYVDDQTLHDIVMEDIMNFFQYDRVDIKPYDLHKAGIWYMSKEGLDGEGYSLLGNKLNSNVRKSA